MTREKCGCLAVPATVRAYRYALSIASRKSVLEPIPKPSHAAARVLGKVLGTLRKTFMKYVSALLT
jgi:hypothetical protein